MGLNIHTRIAPFKQGIDNLLVWTNRNGYLVVFFGKRKH